MYDKFLRLNNMHRIFYADINKRTRVTKEEIFDRHYDGRNLKIENVQKNAGQLIQYYINDMTMFLKELQKELDKYIDIEIKEFKKGE